MAFRFKQFSVNDSGCAMKVGTDAVLLGAGADYTGTKDLLDIGTGSGLLALMAAQESNAMITAIDIDADSCIQAGENFRNSPWVERLQCIHQGLEEFAKSRTASDSIPFDHIITNPPYFINSLKSPDKVRNTARHNDDLPLNTLVELSNLLLKDSGKLSIVFPYAESQLLITAAARYSLNLSCKLIIFPKEGKEPNRILLEFNKGINPPLQSDSLTIRDEKGHYTNQYINLTERFYLGLKGAH